MSSVSEGTKSQFYSSTVLTKTEPNWNSHCLISSGNLPVDENNLSPNIWHALWLDLSDLCLVQTPYFTWAESNANEREQRIFVSCIRFGSCEVQCLNLSLYTEIIMFRQFGEHNSLGL